MANDFLAEYVQRTNNELLRLALDRDSLTTDAAVALDQELRRRDLTESDKLRYQRCLRRNARYQAMRHRPIFRERSYWVDLFWTFLVILPISISYSALPDRFHMSADWEASAVVVMFTAACIACPSGAWRRRIAFWVCLAASSAIQLTLVHEWIRRAGEFTRYRGHVAILLGLVLFGTVYGSYRWLHRKPDEGERLRY